MRISNQKLQPNKTHRWAAVAGRPIALPPDATPGYTCPAIPLCTLLTSRVWGRCPRGDSRAPPRPELTVTQQTGRLCVPAWECGSGGGAEQLGTETKRKQDMAPTPLLGNCGQGAAAAGVTPTRGAKGVILVHVERIESVATSPLPVYSLSRFSVHRDYTDRTMLSLSWGTCSVNFWGVTMSLRKFY